MSTNQIIVTEEEVTRVNELLEGNSKSEVIRVLLGEGYTRGKVGKLVGVTYQRVYNTEKRWKEAKNKK